MYLAPSLSSILSEQVDNLIVSWFRREVKLVILKFDFFFFAN